MGAIANSLRVVSVKRLAAAFDDADRKEFGRAALPVAVETVVRTAQALWWACWGVVVLAIVAFGCGLAVRLFLGVAGLR